MQIQVTNEKSFIYSYVQLLQSRFGLSARETEVASAIVHKYYIFEKARSKFSSSKKREEYDPFTEIRKKEVLMEISSIVEMDFFIFRGYVKSLKEKGFFEKGTINPVFIPTGKEASIEIVWT
jgi:hypothetical protein